MFDLGNTEDEDHDDEKEGADLAKVNAAIRSLIDSTGAPVHIDAFWASTALMDGLNNMSGEIAEKLKTGGEVVEYDSNDEPFRIVPFSDVERDRLEDVMEAFDRWAAVAEEINWGLSTIQDGGAS